MEISGEDSSRIILNPNSKIVFGRGSGFETTDRKVSRRQVLFAIEDSDVQTEPKVSFEVIGKNPVWIRKGESGEVKMFRRFEKGEMAAGDWVCVCGQNPVWFEVKRNFDFQEETEASSNEELEDIDLSKIDPVKEFGFLVIGHEFDQYPKQSICDIKNWDWFLKVPRGDSDYEDDEFSSKSEMKVLSTRKRSRKKRGGKGKGEDDNDEDDDWTGESEEDKEIIGKTSKIGGRPSYSTRSNSRPLLRSSRISKKSKDVCDKEVDSGDEDDDDDTLGGFIVDDENEELEEASDVGSKDEDEEEEFDDYKDDD